MMLFEVFRGNFGGRDVQGEDLEGKVLEGELLPSRGPIAGEPGDFFGDKETAIRSKALEDHFLEGELRSVSMCQLTVCVRYNWDALTSYDPPRVLK